LRITIKNFDGTLVEAVLHDIVVEGFEDEIMAGTYRNLAVACKNNQWRATVVFDI